jgi:5-methylcytosine-specific restriction endonuclease McrA
VGPSGISTRNPWHRVQEEFACEHQATEVRRLVASNGVTHWREQCLRCGDSVRAVRVRAVPLSAQLHPVEFDDGLRKAWGEARAARYGEIVEEARDAERQERRRAYHAYLATPAWSIRRARVLERAGHLCEGCRRRRPVEVHHLTYERAGREMLFDLVAVCRECHEAIHAMPEGE